jgi:NADPH:quinone reductase-like Zn-dependent oxidoreductase
MKALYYEEFKGYDSIKLGDVPEPELADDNVIVRVKAFSLNHIDVWAMNGKLMPERIPVPHIFASDASGVVERVGGNVKHLSAGDEVIIFPGLSCGHCERCIDGRDNECSSFSVLGVFTPGVSAEYASVPARNIFRKPAGLSFEEASGIGITYSTAWNSLVLRANIRQGDTVLIHGGSGGAGIALIQVARLYNCNIITTVGDDWKSERVKEIGADYVINYTKDDFVEAVRRITDGKLADIAVDHIGAATFNRTMHTVKKGGQVVFFGSTTGNEVTFDLRQAFSRNLTLHGIYTGPGTAFPDILRLFPKHLKVVIDSVFTFEKGASAYEKLATRQFFGKIVVKI